MTLDTGIVSPTTETRALAAAVLIGADPVDYDWDEAELLVAVAQGTPIHTDIFRIALRLIAIFAPPTEDRT